MARITTWTTVALCAAAATLAACGEVLDSPDAGGAPDATAPQPDAEADPPDAAGPDAAQPATHRFGENDGADTRGVTSDTYISAAEPTSNFGARVNFWVDDTEPRQSLIRFDLSSLPAATAVTAASLRLTTRSDSTANSTKAILIYRVLEPWDELSATNDQRQEGVAWAAPGVGPGSRDDVAQASFEPIEIDSTYVIPLPTQLVQDWVDDPSINFGLVLVPTSVDGASFHSSQSVDSALRPMLELDVE